MIYDIIIASLVIIAACLFGYRSIWYRKTYGSPPGRIKNLSWPAKQLVAKYNSIPEANRPYADIVSIVSALDIKCGGAQKVTRHFTKSGYDSLYRTWDCCQLSRYCDCVEYKTLRTGMNDIIKAIETQEQALKTADISGRLSDVQVLIGQMHEEAGIVNQITKEITGG